MPAIRANVLIEVENFISDYVVLHKFFGGKVTKSFSIPQYSIISISIKLSNFTHKRYQKINKMHYKVYVLSLRILHPKVWDVRFKVWDVRFKLWDREKLAEKNKKLRAPRKTESAQLYCILGMLTSHCPP
jgi:hypothetical protein